MKNPVLIFFVLTFFVNVATAQSFDNNIMKKQWKAGTENIIFGTKILRVEGSNGVNGITNIGYLSLVQLQRDNKERAEKEMWAKAKIDETIAYYDSSAKGGMIHLYLTRLTISAANTEFFTVIVQDSLSNELFRKELKARVAKVPSGDSYWWNTAYVYLPIVSPKSFYVYVIDELDRENPRTKFLVQR